MKSILIILRALCISIDIMKKTVGDVNGSFFRRIVMTLKQLNKQIKLKDNQVEMEWVDLSREEDNDEKYTNKRRRKPRLLLDC